MGSNSEIQGYNFYPMLYFRRQFSSGIIAFNKENSIEFPLDLLHYIYNYYVAMLLISYGLHVTHQLTSLSHAVTMTCDSI